MATQTQRQPITEQYRPRQWSEVVGQDKAVKLIRRGGALKGFGGNPWWISGKSGTGKTTLAYLIARELTQPGAIEEIDGTEVNREWIQHVSDRIGARILDLDGSGKTGRAYIVNEAHGIKGGMITQLLKTIERFPEWMGIIFTTTIDGMDKFEGNMDAAPFLSRCRCISLTTQGLAQTFAERAKMIATAEGVDGKPIGAYVRLAQETHNNLRAMLNQISLGVMLD